jgi:ribulose-phosphate 3-epimerase
MASQRVPHRRQHYIRQLRLGEEVEAVVAGPGPIVHFDVMDNHYVPNLTIGRWYEALRPH